MAIARRDRAYWTLWNVRGPRLRSLPESIEALTGERDPDEAEDGAPGGRTGPPTAEKLAELRAAAERHRSHVAARQDTPPARHDRRQDREARRQLRDETFAAEFRRLHQSGG